MPHKIARYGWIPSLPDQRDLKYRASADLIEHGTATLPTTVDLSSQCPPILDQGQLGSCTANAIAGAYDFERHWQGEPFMGPSRLFIYYNERALEGTVNSDAGANLVDGFKCINTQGVCYESAWPYDISRFAVKPPERCYHRATNNKCLQYLSLDTSGYFAEYVAYAALATSPKIPTPGVTMTAQGLQLRQCLAEGFPFVFGFTVYESFESDAVAASGIVPMPAASESVVGGHAVYCVGYDDNTQTFRCRNSWGTSWGQKGEFTIPYAYLTNPNLASDFWTIRLVSK